MWITKQVAGHGCSLPYVRVWPPRSMSSPALLASRERTPSHFVEAAQPRAMLGFEHAKPSTTARAEGTANDVWMCEECLAVWLHTGYAWRRANWLRSLLVRRRAGWV